MNEINKNNDKYASFCNGDPLAAFLYKHGDKFTHEERIKITRDFLDDKDDWMPVVDE